MRPIILIIDDDPVFQVIARKMFQLADASVETISCGNGKLGMETLTQTIEHHASITILLDINMPVMDGWTFLEEYVKWPLTIRDKVKLYMVTSSTDSDDLVRAEQHEAVIGLFTKPLSIEDIGTLLHQDE